MEIISLFSLLTTSKLNVEYREDDDETAQRKVLAGVASTKLYIAVFATHGTECCDFGCLMNLRISF